VAFHTLYFVLRPSLFPHKQDESVLTLGVMDLNIVDTSSKGESVYVTSLTTPRSLVIFYTFSFCDVVLIDI